MMGRKKRILIIVLSIITVLILIIGGVLIYLNVATDAFKIGRASCRERV